jgi:endonuclease/exonuclease/phosphatase family metal-dependent hydrolase
MEQASPIAKAVFNSLMQRLPMKTLVGLAVVLAAGVVAYFAATKLRNPAPQAGTTPASSTEDGTVFFCWWNVENLFDDKDDKRNSIDEEYDNPFAKDEKLRNLKLDRIASTLLAMNDGNGPDVMALCEVENVRSAELLMATMNKKLNDAGKDKKLEYKNVVMRNLDAGRHIAPAVITRMNVAPQLTRMHGNKLRILESHLYVNGHDLCIIASHWTSQLKQRDGSDGDAGREKYAIAIYEAFRAAAKKNVDCDFLVCGDFNDTPDAEPVAKVLGAIGDRTKVKPTDNEPYLLNLLGGKDPNKFGTLFYSGKPLIYDHICVSPGLLDSKGWSVEPDTVQTYTTGLMRKGATRREPWRFGSPENPLKESDRGYSDHFPVTVRLKVAPAKP